MDGHGFVIGLRCYRICDVWCWLMYAMSSGFNRSVPNFGQDDVKMGMYVCGMCEVRIVGMGGFWLGVGSSVW